jgi:hypothetical protein
MRSAAPDDAQGNGNGGTIARINANAESFAKDMEQSRDAEAAPKIASPKKDGDLTPILQQSLKRAKAARIARPN